MAAVPAPKLAAADAMPPPADPVNQGSSGGDFMDVLNLAWRSEKALAN